MKLEPGDPRLDRVTGSLDGGPDPTEMYYGGGDETDRDDAPPPGEAPRAPGAIATRRSTGARALKHPT